MPNDEWGEVPLPKTSNTTTSEDPNDDLYSDEALEQVAEKVTKEKAKARSIERAKEEAAEEEYEEQDVSSDEGAPVNEDADETNSEEEENTQTTDEEESGKSEEAGEEATAEAKKTESRIPKRIEQLINKLKEKDALEQQREYEFAQREAQLLQAIQELETQSSSNATLVASSQLKEAESAVEIARRKLRNAKMNADDDAELEALEELADAKARQREATALAAKAPKVDAETRQQQAPVNPRQIIGYRKNQVWVESNKQALANPQVAIAIQSIDKQLLQEGFDPAEDDYRSELSKRANKTLSNKGLSVQLNNPFELANYGDDVVGDVEEEKTVTQQKQSAPAVKKPLNPMSKGSPMQSKKTKTVARLDDNDKYLAHKFGLKGENLLKQRALSSRATGDYIPVYVPTDKNKKK